MRRMLTVGAVALLTLATVACAGASANSNGDVTTSPPGIAVGEPNPNGGNGAPPPGPDAGYETKLVIAPTLEAEVQTGAAGYALRLVSEVGDGCNRFAGVEVTRDGDRIDVTAQRTVPARPEVVLCMMLYQTHEETVALGDDFASGHEYTVSINGGERTLTFVAR